MKALITLSTIFLLINNIAFSQDEVDGSEDLISQSSFKQMVVQDITYAIIGESTPVSGIKVDISKPEATITGLFRLENEPSVILGLEVKGGVIDNNFNVFNKGISSFNTAFELKPKLHLILPGNKAKYYSRDTLLVRANNLLYRSQMPLQRDSFYMAAILYNHYLSNFEDSEYTDQTLPNDQNISISQKMILIHFIKKTMDTNNGILNASNSLSTILGVVERLDTLSTGGLDIETYKKEIVSDFMRYKTIFDKQDENLINEEIKNASKVWTIKKYKWLTFDPFVKTEKINQYYIEHEGDDSMYFNTNYDLSYGIKVYLNYLHIRTQKVAVFLRGGVQISHTNNLSSISSFNYEDRSPLFINGINVIEKVKSGIAYNNSDFKEGFLGEGIGEIYILPLKSFLPGGYLSSSFSRSNLNQLPNVMDRENDKLRISVEGGPVFNINSREKDKEKSILSFSAYVRFEDVTDSRRVNIKNNEMESREDYLNRNLSFGLKVGIPIALPKRS